MGIERIDAPALRARQRAVEDLRELGGSRAPPKTPQRQRGLWSFLTWPFVIAPFVAAESFLAGNRHALASEDQDGRAADHGKGQPDTASDHDQAAAPGPNHAAQDSQDDKTDVGPRIIGVPKVSHGADAAHEAHAKAPVAHESAIAAAASPPGDGGGSAGSESTSPSDTSTSLDSDSATSGAPIGGDSGLVHTATGVFSTLADGVSTLTDGISDVLAPVGLGGLIGSVDLKNLLGFDLHVSSSGEFMATDLGAVLDQSPLLPLTDTVSHVVSPVVVGLAVPGLGMPNALDSLFGGHSTAVAPLGDLSSLLGTGDIGSDDATWIGKGILTGNTSSVDKLADALLATPLDGGSNPLLPIAGDTTDPAHVSIIGDATSVTPGHSIDFPAPVSAEGDVLFRGNSYTDYHVALQSTGTSVVSNITPALTSVASTASDTASLAHVDSPAANPAVASPVAPAQHQDTSLAHISTTLDDLSLRTHTH